MRKKDILASSEDRRELFFLLFTANRCREELETLKLPDFLPLLELRTIR
jgi:hypothetical protein